MSAEIRQFIHRQLSEDIQMAGMLATYNGMPAIFYQKAPSDSRSGWGEKQYPRIDFTVDMRYDPEHKTAGILTVNIWCNTECVATGNLDPDKEIEARLIELISGTFYTGNDEATIYTEWEQSDDFTVENNAQHNTHPEVYGISVTFGLMEFPEQITTSPDPVQGLNAWTKQHFPLMTVISYDLMPPIWKPTDENPAIYWRFEGTASINRQSYAVTWFDGTFAAHVIAKSVTERNKWTKAIIEKMQIDGEVILSDTSPMFINKLTIKHNADSLREGQLELIGQYGVLSQHRKESAQIKFKCQ